MAVDSKEYPTFYKLLFEEGFRDKILMPRAFVKKHMEMLSKTCTLITEGAREWEANIVREKSNFFICEEEWTKFVGHHNFELGDILVFFLIDKSKFRVQRYEEKRFDNLGGPLVFEDLSVSSSEDESDIRPSRKLRKVQTEPVESDIGPSRKLRKVQMEPIESSHSKEEWVDPSRGTKDGVNPCYSHSGIRGHNHPDKPVSNVDKRPVFLEEWRKLLEDQNSSNKSVSNVDKAEGDKWKQLSDAEKAPPYQVESEDRKADFGTHMDAYGELILM